MEFIVFTVLFFNLFLYFNSIINPHPTKHFHTSVILPQSPPSSAGLPVLGSLLAQAGKSFVWIYDYKRLLFPNIFRSLNPLINRKQSPENCFQPDSPRILAGGIRAFPRIYRKKNIQKIFFYVAATSKSISHTHSFVIYLRSYILIKRSTRGSFAKARAIVLECHHGCLYCGHKSVS